MATARPDYNLVSNNEPYYLPRSLYAPKADLCVARHRISRSPRQLTRQPK